MVSKCSFHTGNICRFRRAAVDVAGGNSGRVGTMPADPSQSETTQQPEVIGLLSRLIRFDTTNFGGGRSHGETECAEWVADQLRSVGWQPQLLHRADSPDRGNVVLRVPGTDPGLPGLVVQGHLDVVPAEADQWSADPFSGDVRDGYVHGRGAMDMKDSCAMTLATLLEWGRSGVRPRRDIVAVFVADEEDAGAWGAEWLVDEHADLFAGCGGSIGESGGGARPVSTADGSTVRLYPIAAGERGTMHIRLTARGTSGHGSRPKPDNAVRALAEAVLRIASHPWPLHLSDVVRAEIEQTSAAVGRKCDLSTEEGILAAVAALAEVSEVLGYTIRGSATPTMLAAGYKVNVVPGVATAECDVRCPPGHDEQMHQVLGELIGPDVEWEYSSRQAPVQSPTDGEWFDAMRAAILRHDPDARVVPYCMGGGTDSKAFARLGIQTYGFTPMGLDPQGRTVEGMHGIDERTPVASVVAGQRILDDFLRTV